MGNTSTLTPKTLGKWGGEGLGTRNISDELLLFSVLIRGSAFSGQPVGLLIMLHQR